jgi:hypothetical protein
MSMTTDDFTRQVSEAFGVTPEEIDAVDRVLYGPEVRAMRAEGEALVLANVDWAMEETNTRLRAMGLSEIEFVPLEVT